MSKKQDPEHWLVGTPLVPRGREQNPDKPAGAHGSLVASAPEDLAPSDELALAQRQLLQYLEDEALLDEEHVSTLEKVCRAVECSLSSPDKSLLQSELARNDSRIGDLEDEILHLHDALEAKNLQLHSANAENLVLKAKNLAAGTQNCPPSAEPEAPLLKRALEEAHREQEYLKTQIRQLMGLYGHPDEQLAARCYPRGGYPGASPSNIQPHSTFSASPSNIQPQSMFSASPMTTPMTTPMSSPTRGLQTPLSSPGAKLQSWGLAQLGISTPGSNGQDTAPTEHVAGSPFGVNVVAASVARATAAQAPAAPAPAPEAPAAPAGLLQRLKNAKPADSGSMDAEVAAEAAEAAERKAAEEEAAAEAAAQKAWEAEEAAAAEEEAAEAAAQKA